MKKKFANLSQQEQEQGEAAYHRVKPQEFDRLMARAKRYSPPAIRLPAAWLDRLEAMAEFEAALRIKPDWEIARQRLVQLRAIQP